MAKTGEGFFEAEQYRLQGELLLGALGGEANRGGVLLSAGLDVARRQQAKSLELRTAVSLSRLWQQQGKRVEARELLAPIYGWFTEGFDTADLQEAKALLEELGDQTGAHQFAETFRPVRPVGRKRTAVLG